MIMKVENEVDVRKGNAFEKNDMNPLVEITAQRFGLQKNHISEYSCWGKGVFENWNTELYFEHTVEDMKVSDRVLL